MSVKQGGENLVYFEHIRLPHEVHFQRGFVKEYDYHDTHIHELLEVDIICKGSIRQHIAGVDVIGHEGDVFVFRPFEPHWGFPNHREEQAERLLLLFSPAALRSVPAGNLLLMPFYTHANKPFRLTADNEHARLIRQAAEDAVRMKDQSAPAWEAKQYARFVSILTHIYDHYESSRVSSGLDEPHPGMISSIDYLIRTSNQQVDLEEAARLSGYGKTMFYRKFRQAVGLSPNDFVNRMRLQLAASQLLRTEQPVLDISIESGFASLSSFNKLFKREFGCSPRVYRKEHKG